MYLAHWSLRIWESGSTRVRLGFILWELAGRVDLTFWFDLTDWVWGDFSIFWSARAFSCVFISFWGFSFSGSPAGRALLLMLICHFDGTHLNVWAKKGRATILVTIYLREKLKRWSKNGKFTNLLFIIGHVNCDKICNNYYSPNIILMDNIYMSFFFKVHLVRGVKK